MQSLQGRAARKERFPVAIDAVVFRGDDSKVTVRLADFSEQGCRMESEAHFSVGETLQIAVERMGLMKAQVRWTTSTSSGVRFLIESDF